MTLDSNFFVFIKTVWAMKCLLAIQNSLYKVSRSKNKYNRIYISKCYMLFTLGKSVQL